MIEGLIVVRTMIERAEEVKAFCSVFRVWAALREQGELTLVKTGSFGDRSGEGTPGPIPNPEVKLSSADGTALEAGWESRSSPTEPVFSFSPAVRASSFCLLALWVTRRGLVSSRSSP